jgi:isoleucyl-tRNA synthetase
MEQRVLAFWNERRIFPRSMEQRAGAPPFVFYEGPPTANGRPGAHHVFSRVFKDIFPRFASGAPTTSVRAWGADGSSCQAGRSSEHPATTARDTSAAAR